MRIFLKLRPRGVRLGPTDVLEPLFEFLYTPFNLLKYFKDGVHRSKLITSLSQTRMQVIVSGTDLPLISVCVNVCPAFLVGDYYLSGNGPCMRVCKNVRSGNNQLNKASGGPHTGGSPDGVGLRPRNILNINK